MFVKLGHQSHAVFPDDPSCFVAVFVIFESVIDRKSSHPNIHAWLQWIAFGIEPQSRRMLCNSVVKENHINIVMKIHFFLTCWFFPFHSGRQQKLSYIRSARLFPQKRMTAV